MKEVDVEKIDVSTGKVQKIRDYVAEEAPLHVFLNRTHYATIFCSPSNLKELAIGHLLTEGIVKSVEEIENIRLKNEGVCQARLKLSVDLEKRLRLTKPYARVILSACGSTAPLQFSGKLPKIKSDLHVKADIIFNCVGRLNSVAETFRKTRGVHVAAIYKSDGNLVAFAEDVGRHNAVDKVIGICALIKIDFGKCFLASSGRLTGDIVLKAARMGIPIVASLTAAINSGIVIAKNVGLTLIGKRTNVYSFPERILS